MCRPQESPTRGGYTHSGCVDLRRSVIPRRRAVALTRPNVLLSYAALGSTRTRLPACLIPSEMFHAGMRVPTIAGSSGSSRDPAAVGVAMLALGALGNVIGGFLLASPRSA